MAGTSEPKPKRPKTEALPPVNANECITCHLLKRLPDGTVVMEENGHFSPEMTHQLFGEEECIKGYDGLEIDIFFTPRFQALLDVKYAARTAHATDLEKPFKAAFSAGFFETKLDFDAALQAEAPLDVARLGRVLESAATEEGSTFRVVHAMLAEAPEAVRALHSRLQPLLYFFVDGARAIDATERGWEFLLVVETPAGGGGCGEVVGFATLHRFWVFPDRRRLRVSQVLVLPPHQGRGAGSLLLRAAYKLAEQLGAVDVPFEDASEDMQRVRDRLDLKRMLQLGWPRAEAEQRIAAVLAGDPEGSAPRKRGAKPPHSPLAPSPELLARLQSELRLAAPQARRMWETMLYAVAVRSGPEAAAAVEGAVHASLEAAVAGAKQGACGKSIRNDEGHGFAMFRGAAGGAATATAGEVVPVEGVTEEQRHGEIDGAVAARIEEMRLVVDAVEEQAEDNAAAEGDAGR